MKRDAYFLGVCENCQNVHVLQTYVRVIVEVHLCRECRKQEAMVMGIVG